jgi:hypothetical protein
MVTCSQSLFAIIVGLLRRQMLNSSAGKNYKNVLTAMKKNNVYDSFSVFYNNVLGDRIPVLRPKYRRFTF